MSRTALRVVAIAAIVPLAALLLSGCGNGGGQPGLSDLRKTPGAQAAYPGAVEYRRVEADASANAMAKNPAQIKVDACARDGSETVLAWFTEHLRGSGWTRDPGHTVVSDTREFEPHGTSWSRGDLHFDLRFLTSAFADHLADQAGKPRGCVAAYETIVS